MNVYGARSRGYYFEVCCESCFAQSTLVFFAFVFLTTYFFFFSSCIHGSITIGRALLRLTSTHVCCVLVVCVEGGRGEGGLLTRSLRLLLCHEATI